ncbi:A-kinase anchor protein 200-like [Physella acuta]|uniref:A-kinase anchor protein 200-like n=1 Tax=Physella acuta TaxID=109671 RepID=UPI0027DAFFDF|nr:A-kinase anchor protein 200-like [Physella acuta]
MTTTSPEVNETNKVESNKNTMSIIIAAIALVVFAVIIIVFTLIFIRHRRGRQRLAVYHKDDEYAVIDATNTKKNLRRDKNKPSVRKTSTADVDNDVNGDNDATPPNDAQYSVLSDTSRAYARISVTRNSKPEGKPTPKQSTSATTSGAASEQQTSLTAVSAETEQIGLYSTVNKLKKKSLTASDAAPVPSPAPAPGPAADPALESNDVYSHLSHLKQNKPETENVYNG